MRLYHDRRLLIPFRSALLPQIFTDVLVVGTGVAGLRTAIEAARHGDVVVLAKEAVDLSNTSWAQGGIAAAIASDDSPQSHVTDTLDAGAGLCDPAAVRALVTEGPREVAQLRCGKIGPGRHGPCPALPARPYRRHGRRRLRR